MNGLAGPARPESRARLAQGPGPGSPRVRPPMQAAKACFAQMECSRRAMPWLRQVPVQMPHQPRPRSSRSARPARIAVSLASEYYNRVGAKDGASQCQSSPRNCSDQCHPSPPPSPVSFLCPSLQHARSSPRLYARAEHRRRGARAAMQQAVAPPHFAVPPRRLLMAKPGTQPPQPTITTLLNSQKHLLAHTYFAGCTRAHAN